MNSIGIFISQFDPLTTYHMQMAAKVLDQVNTVSQIWFVAYGQSPTPLKHRQAMLIHAIQSFFPETKAIQCMQLQNNMQNSDSMLEIFQYIKNANQNRQCLLVCSSDQYKCISDSEVQNATICYSLDSPTKMPKYLIKLEDGISFDALRVELLKRLKMIDRSSNMECSKVLNLIPKVALQYIIINRLYME